MRISKSCNIRNRENCRTESILSLKSNYTFKVKYSRQQSNTRHSKDNTRHSENNSTGRSLFHVTQKLEKKIVLILKINKGGTL